MKRLEQNEYNQFINSSTVAVLVISRENCQSCESIKKVIIPMVKQKLPNVAFAEFVGSSDVYPVNILMEKFNFRTVPTCIIFVNGEAKKAVKGVVFSKELVQEVQKFM